MDLPPSLEAFFAPLADVVPPLRVAIEGSWSTSRRLTYEQASQSGTGDGPFVEVEDVRWKAECRAQVPLAGLFLFCTGQEVSWVKSYPAAMIPEVEISLHAWAHANQSRASFAASFRGAVTPSVPVSAGPDLRQACELGQSAATTGRIHVLAKTVEATVGIVLLPGDLLKVGRNRLWHLREEVAAPLPSALRHPMTRRRTGTIP